MKLYSVYDVVSKSYSELFCAPAGEVAKRNFRFTMTRYDDFFVKDMELHYIADFDNTTGLVVVGPITVVDSGVTILDEKKILKEAENEKSSL